MSDYDMLVKRVETDGYIPEYGMENLVLNVLAHCDDEFNIDECIDYVYGSGGWKEFDYIA